MSEPPHKLPDDARYQTEDRPEPEPRAEGGENVQPEPYPPGVKKDDSVQPAAEDRSFEGEAANAQPRRGSGDEADPEGHHGGMSSGDGADEDADRR